MEAKATHATTPIIGSPAARAAHRWEPDTCRWPERSDRGRCPRFGSPRTTRVSQSELSWSRDRGHAPGRTHEAFGRTRSPKRRPTRSDQKHFRGVGRLDPDPGPLRRRPLIKLQANRRLWQSRPSDARPCQQVTTLRTLPPSVRRTSCVHKYAGDLAADGTIREAGKEGKPSDKGAPISHHLRSAG